MAAYHISYLLNAVDAEALAEALAVPVAEAVEVFAAALRADRRVASATVRRATVDADSATAHDGAGATLAFFPPGGGGWRPALPRCPRCLSAARELDWV